MRAVGGVDGLQGVDGHLVVGDVHLFRSFDDHRTRRDPGKDRVSDLDKSGPRNLETVNRDVRERHVLESAKKYYVYYVAKNWKLVRLKNPGTMCTFIKRCILPPRFTIRTQA